MTITPLSSRPTFDSNPKLNKLAIDFQDLLSAIEKKEIPEEPAKIINSLVEEVNSLEARDKELINALRSTKKKIITLLEKELKIVPIGYYQQQWMILGMTSIGLPLGVAFGVAMGNMAFLGIGLPIGMSVGIGIGTSKDNQAKKEERQLDWKMK